MIHLPNIVGIVNLTPDSFSDGGIATEHAMAAARQMIEDGATVIDIGAESTRPGAEALSAENEWQRLEAILTPLIALCHTHNVKVSIDTYHPATAEKAIDRGVDWVNDVTGFREPGMIELLRDANVVAVLTHSLTVPVDPQIVMQTDTPVETVYAWAAQALDQLESKGFSRERLIFDPGIGFGKTPAHSMQLMIHAYRFHELGVRVLIGHSRKSFIRTFNEKASPVERDLETAVLSAFLTNKGIDYLRVHNVDYVARALKTAAAVYQVSGKQ